MNITRILAVNCNGSGTIWTSNPQDFRYFDAFNADLCMSGKERRISDKNFSQKSLSRQKNIISGVVLSQLANKQDLTLAYCNSGSNLGFACATDESTSRIYFAIHS